MVPAVLPSTETLNEEERNPQTLSQSNLLQETGCWNGGCLGRGYSLARKGEFRISPSPSVCW